MKQEPVAIVDYDARWPAHFAELSKVLFAALRELALAIEHVGSTAVPGMAAKPIIDVDVVIAVEQQLPEAVARLAELGYGFQGDGGIPGRYAFTALGADVPRDGTGRCWPKHHLYVCPQDSLELKRHLAFRDILRAQPSLAAEYAELKRDLARRFRDDRDAYTVGKGHFVDSALRRLGLAD